MSVWATGIQAPLINQDPDVRLREEHRDNAKDQVYGQYGWDVGVEFNSLEHLSRLLAGGEFRLPSHVPGKGGPIAEGQIRKLGILAHGYPGAVDIDAQQGVTVPSYNDPNSTAATDWRFLNKNTVNTKYDQPLSNIERMLAPGAYVYLMSCNSARSKDGRDLVLELSKKFRAKRISIVGFSTILYVAAGGPDSQKKSVLLGTASYPGARETHALNPSYKTPIAQQTKKNTPYYTHRENWLNLSILPWASNTTPHAFVARCGAVVKYAKSGVPGPWDPGDGIPTVDDL